MPNLLLWMLYKQLLYLLRFTFLSLELEYLFLLLPLTYSFRLFSYFSSFSFYITSYPYNHIFYSITYVVSLNLSIYLRTFTNTYISYKMGWLPILIWICPVISFNNDLALHLEWLISKMTYIIPINVYGWYDLYLDQGLLEFFHFRILSF